MQAPLCFVKSMTHTCAWKQYET